MTSTHVKVLQSIANDKNGCLLNDYESAAVRFEKQNGENVWFLKFKGEKEFRVEYSHRLVFEAIQEAVTLTKDEYDAF